MAKHLVLVPQKSASCQAPCRRPQLRIAFLGDLHIMPKNQNLYCRKDLAPSFVFDELSIDEEAAFVPLISFHRIRFDLSDLPMVLLLLFFLLKFAKTLDTLTEFCLLFRQAQNSPFKATGGSNFDQIWTSSSLYVVPLRPTQISSYCQLSVRPRRIIMV